LTKKKKIMDNGHHVTNFHLYILAKRRARSALFNALKFENYELCFFLWNFDFD